jgi:hypothetical protein
MASRRESAEELAADAQPSRKIRPQGVGQGAFTDFIDGLLDLIQEVDA